MFCKYIVYWVGLKTGIWGGEISAQFIPRGNSRVGCTFRFCLDAEDSSGVMRGAESPRDFWLGNFCWRIGKKEARKKGKRGENWEEKEKKENYKREGGKLKMEVGKVIKEVRTFFFFFFFFFFLLFTFENDNFVLGLPKWEFFTGKKHFTPVKKSGKITLTPQKNTPVTPLEDRTAHLCSCSQNNKPHLLTKLAIFSCILLYFWTNIVFFG